MKSFKMTITMTRTGCLCLGLCVVLATTGCQTVPAGNYAGFATGVTTARNQAQLAFQEFTDLTNDAIIDYAAKQPTLQETNFFVVLDPAAVAGWDRVFAALEKYSQSLSLLTSPNLTKDDQTAASQLADEIKSTGVKLHQDKLLSQTPGVVAPLAAGFIKLGDLLRRANAQADARRIMTETDPTIRQIFLTLADMIGSAPTSGLRGTVFAHWSEAKGVVSLAFISETDFAKRRALAAKYAVLLNQQRAQDLALTSLRRSFLALAAAHHSLTQGHTASAAAAIAAVIAEIEDTKAMFVRFNSSLRSSRE